MSKRGDLWDDSALCTAMDQAISNYLKLQRNVGADQSGSGVDVENKEALRQENENEDINLQTNTSTEVGESSNASVISQIQNAESIVPHVPDSHDKDSGAGQNSDPSSQGSQAYDQLVNQYYEIEQQRQRILNQLYQNSGWNTYYGGDYNSGVQGGQAPNVATYSYCPCVGQCCAAPLSTSAPSCFWPGHCADSCGPMRHNKSTVSQEDTDIVETAMGAAQSAMSTLGMKVADVSNLGGGAIEVGENDGTEEASTQSASSGTDLTAVLNAWYSAGFFTGKYLVEQSIAKKHHK